jgi:glycosyltransferase involved in cell wall biosynthesis
LNAATLYHNHNQPFDNLTTKALLQTPCKNFIMKISLIITTYNRLPALQAVIGSLTDQRHHADLEVIVADDGSTPETAAWLQQQSHLPVLHVWQPDEGFKAAQIRNRAAAKAAGDYLIFIDGDCIAPADFLKNHTKLAEENYLVSGNRILLSSRFTDEVLNQHLPIHTWPYKQWLLAYLQGKCNRALPFLPGICYLLPYQHSQQWQGAKTCNLGLWRQDFLKVNGFDESYQGWGYEDSDLVIRLLRAGIKRKHSRFLIPVLHLWHAENDRSKQESNRLALANIINSKRVMAQQGVDQYL